MSRDIYCVASLAVKLCRRRLVLTVALIEQVTHKMCHYIFVLLTKNVEKSGDTKYKA